MLGDPPGGTLMQQMLEGMKLLRSEGPSVLANDLEPLR
jgi:hypothetical protein